jgi:uncharacterized repeat protein (TIGR03803 family)
MSAATVRNAVAEGLGRSGRDQLNSSQGSSRFWLRPSVGMAAAAVAALFLLIAGAGQQVQAQTFTVVHNFTGPDGADPLAGLIMDSSGNLYGTTEDGGSSFEGTVFKIDSSGTETVLQNFSGGDGAFPGAGLVMDSSGDLYGTALFGGSNRDGTVFELGPANTETVLLNFRKTYGIFPSAGLIRDSQGNLYGTTSSAGANGDGTVFKIDSSGAATVFHNFTGTDGASPLAGLIMDSTGNLYGTTANGGTYNAGTVFKLDPSGNATVLHGFNPSTDGGYPEAGLIMDSSGSLYGTTAYRGSSANGGTVFKVDPSGNLTVLHIFGGNDGLNPVAGLIMDSSGNLYGTTAYGGSNGDGTVFKIAMTVPFASFSVDLNAKGSSQTIEMKALFTPGAGASAIDPVTQGMTLTVGSYTVTIPAGSFSATNGRMWMYQGTINGVTLEAHIMQSGTKSYQLQLVATNVDLTSLTNPVTVTLTIGNNIGTTQVNR